MILYDVTFDVNNEFGRIDRKVVDSHLGIHLNCRAEF
jgi:hypothetical protein